MKTSLRADDDWAISHKHALQYFDVIVNDYPSEYFLQSPYIFVVRKSNEVSLKIPKKHLIRLIRLILEQSLFVHLLEADDVNVNKEGIYWTAACNPQEIWSVMLPSSFEDLLLQNASKTTTAGSLQVPHHQSKWQTERIVMKHFVWCSQGSQLFAGDLHNGNKMGRHKR